MKYKDIKDIGAGSILDEYSDYHDGLTVQLDCRQCGAKLQWQKRSFSNEQTHNAVTCSEECHQALLATIRAGAAERVKKFLEKASAQDKAKYTNPQPIPKVKENYED